MADEHVAALVWLAIGIIGGIVLNRTERVLPSGWIMAAIFGPFTLILGLWEYCAGRAKP